jgi:rubrerythrin
MRELNDFYNDGFGWICRQCERELTQIEKPENERSRLLTEGEAESKTPRMSNVALAKWADPAQRTLVCPRCGITELADKS